MVTIYVANFQMIALERSSSAETLLSSQAQYITNFPLYTALAGLPR